jgi:hypothetical protein
MTQARIMRSSCGFLGEGGAQVRRGRGAKRGELRGAALAGQGRASGAGGGWRHKAGCLQPPPSAARAVLYGSLCMAADSCGVMGMLWGHFGMCASVLRASWPAHAVPQELCSSRARARLRSASHVSHEKWAHPPPWASSPGRLRTLRTSAGCPCGDTGTRDNCLPAPDTVESLVPI